MFRRVALALLTAYFATGVFAHELAEHDSVVLATPGGTSLASAGDLTLRFTEFAGQEIVLRVSPVDAGGLEIGSGRVVVMLPSETREIRLRDRFAAEALASARLKVEVLRGDGRVSVTAEGLVEQTNATTPKRRAVGPHVPKPGSADLVDQAEASGALDSETALLYRVYALFGDARLPAQFHGEDVAVPDTTYMDVVRQRFASLSPATQSLVQPFLVPPAYKDSWINIKSGSPPRPRTSDTPPPCQFLAANWSYVDALNSPVRVWYESDNGADALTASRAAADVDKFWPMEIGLMHKPGTATGFPLSDVSESCNGGNERLDIYLTDLSPIVKGLTFGFSSCSATPAFIDITRAAETGVLIHEIFHAIQFSYPLSGCWSRDDYRWWGEGSATWAEDYIESALYPGLQTEHEKAAYYTIDPKLPLDYHEGTIAFHAYGTYLLPFYVARSTGSADFVRVAWENCSREPAIEAFDHAAPGALDKIWPEFAKRNWNQKPVDDYQTWDKLDAHVRATSTPDTSTAGDIQLYKMDYELPHTTAIYYDWNFQNLANPSVVFWNGATTSLAERQLSPAIGPQYINDTASGDDTKGAHVSALIRTGSDWRQEDWTGKPYAVFCRDEKADRWDELVLVISNSEFKDRNRKLKPPGLPPLLFVSNVSCWQWKGTVSYSGGASSSNAEVTFQRSDATLQPFAIHYVGQGALSWSVSAPGCSASGTTSVGATNALTVFNFLPPDNPAHGTYAGAGISDPVSVCGGPFQFPWWTSPSPPVVPGIPGARWLHVTDGDTMADTNTALAPAVWQWQLQSQRQ